MAIQAHTTRRALFGAALALSAMPAAHATGIALPQETPSLAYSSSRRLIDALNTPGLVTDADADVVIEEVFRLEAIVLTGEIASRSDAAAKVRLAARSFEDGELADGSDVAALQQVARWLEAN